MKDFLGYFLSLGQVLRCWSVSSGPTLLVRGFLRFKCQNVVLLCLGVVFLVFYKRSSMHIMLHSSGIRSYFQVLSFCLVEGLRVFLRTGISVVCQKGSVYS